MIASATALAGAGAAIHYFQLGLTLAHYDARAHLVVARRILDNLTPGWQQIGAVWLPLPHLLNLLPVQVDAWYRTGASGVAISVLSMGVAAGSLASLLLRTTGSLAGAVAGAVLLVANPNVLYLQSTPMTEPLLFGLTLLSIAATAAWLDLPPDHERQPISSAWRPGAALTAACLTRYEAWAVTAVILIGAGAVLLRRGADRRRAARRVAGLAAWPLAAIAAFSMNSRWVVGEWFVSGGFFVPDNTEALGNPLVAFWQVHDGLTRLAGTVLPAAGYLGAGLVFWTFVRSSSRASLVLLIATLAAAALPVVAYTQGHPFRIRYDLPLVVACAALTSAAIALSYRRLQWPLAVALVAACLFQTPPFDTRAPLVLESQREAANMAGRRAITSYLEAHHDGSAIMMSMGSLGHYMHDLSLAGFDLEDFLHEGNGEIWGFAMLQPKGHAGWLVIEGRAEGGDALHHAARRDRWLDGFDLVAEGGGARLYRAAGR